MIMLSNFLSATNTDLLNGTRLQSAPRNGLMTFQFQADLANATNNFVVSIQLPSGDTPLDGVLVPGDNASLGGVIDTRQMLQVTMPIAQGGHVVVSLTETGAAICTYRITFTPRR